MRLLTALILLLPALAQAQDTTNMSGEWKCEYSARHATDHNKTSAMWFQVMLDEDGTFKGGGKSNTLGLVTKNVLSGDWSWKDETLMLDGKSLSPLGELPFVFAVDRGPDGKMDREWIRNEVENTTRCFH